MTGKKNVSTVKNEIREKISHLDGYKVDEVWYEGRKLRARLVTAQPYSVTQSTVITSTLLKNLRELSFKLDYFSIHGGTVSTLEAVFTYVR
jgi:hypothetical protein